MFAANDIPKRCCRQIDVCCSRHGCLARHRLWFVPSQQLKCLRSRRRRTQNPQMRKELSLQIRTCHKKNLRQWKSEQLSHFLGILSRWKGLQHFLPKSAGRIDVVRPRDNDFACMLAKLSNGPCEGTSTSSVFRTDLDHSRNGSCYSAIIKW